MERGKSMSLSFVSEEENDFEEREGNGDFVHVLQLEEEVETYDSELQILKNQLNKVLQEKGKHIIINFITNFMQKKGMDEIYVLIHVLG